MWKLDLRLVPWLCLLYLVAFLDRYVDSTGQWMMTLMNVRTNIGNAKLAGLREDLNLSNSEYNAALTLFFVSYSVFEPLTNVMLKRWRPSIIIPIMIVLWVGGLLVLLSLSTDLDKGICMTCMGLVHNFSGLIAVRFFLGLAEAGLFPGIGYFLSCRYRRGEFGIRMAIFFSGAALAGSFGGLLAAAIALMVGVGGKAGWCWIFILESLATVLIGAASFWMVQDFPDEATFLSPDDRKRALRRLALDEQASAGKEELEMT